MRKKLLSILLTLCMVMTMLPAMTFAASATSVKIAGITLNSSTPYWVNGQTIAQTSVTTPGSYNAYLEVTTTGSTLYLKNAEINNASGMGVEVGGDLIIACEGNNNVTGSDIGVEVIGQLTISGDGSLSATGTSKYGILVQGTIQTNNISSLTVEGKSYGIYANTFAGNQVDLNVTGDINVKSSEGQGIYSINGNVSVVSESGMVTVDAKDMGLNNTSLTNISGYNGVKINSIQNWGVNNTGTTGGITIDSQNGSVEISGSTAVIANKSGVKISAYKDVSVSGKTGAGIAAKTAVDVTAGGNILVTAQNHAINAFAQGDVSLNAGGSIDIESSVGKMAPDSGMKGINCTNGSVYLAGTVAEGKTLTINNNTCIPENKTFINNGTITLDDGKTFTVYGKLVNSGIITPTPIIPEPKWTALLKDGLTWSDHIVKNDNLYTIKSPLGLAWIAAVTNGTVTADSFANDPDLPTSSTFEGYTVCLANDINLLGNQWVPIGNVYEKQFNGIFDGEGYTISNMTASGRYGGLFGRVGENTVVQHFSISGSVDATGDKSHDGVGGSIAANNEGIISNIISNVTVTAYGNGVKVGGIAGNNDGTIQNCGSLGKVSGESNRGQVSAGGICGKNESTGSLVQNCYAVSSISITNKNESDYIGALVGSSSYYESGKVKNSYWYQVNTSEKGIGYVKDAEISSIGSFKASGDKLTATDGTTLAYNGTLLEALNAWVSEQLGDKLGIWAVNSTVNGGYPVLASKINYVLNKGAWANAYIAPAASIKGVTTMLPSAGDVTRADYIFLGWTTTNNPADTTYLTDMSSAAKGNVTLYAKWGLNKDQAAPIGLTASAPTSTANNDGKILGVSSAMEYRLSSSTTYKEITGTEITGLASGSYQVRYKAKAGNNAGVEASVTVPAYTAPSGGGNSSGNSGSSSGGNSGGGASTPTAVNNTTADPVSPAAVQQAQAAVQKLSDPEKQAIAKNIEEYIPYTLPAAQGITAEQLKVLTKDKFTQSELETMAKKPELLKALGIDVAPLSTAAALKPIENPEFKDVPATHWAADTIKKAAELGIAAGREDGSFAPKQPLQTADTFTFLNRVLLLNNITESTLPRSTVEKYITDKNHWAFRDMASIGAKLSENTLKAISQRGDQPLTRELLAQVLYEVTKGKLKKAKEVPAFTDIQTSPYQEAINYCVSAGLLNGIGKNTMSPEKELTRAELMAVLIRLNEMLK